MDPTLMKGLKDQYANLSDDGFRVLAVAVKELAGKTSCAKEDEHDLVLKGYVAFLDPPKPTAATAIEALHKHGVVVKILPATTISSAARFAVTLDFLPTQCYWVMRSRRCRTPNCPRRQRRHPSLPVSLQRTNSESFMFSGPRDMLWDSWAMESMMLPHCAPRILASPWILRQTSPRNRPI